MADSVAYLTIPKATWTDVYAGTGIAVGTAVTVYNVGSYPCRLAVKATTPGATTDIGVPLYVGEAGSAVDVSAAGSGLWCYSPDGATKLAVQA